MKSLVVDLCFLLAYACIALAVATRLDPGAAEAADLKWWAIGISVLFFTAVAAERFARNHRTWSTERLARLRVWFASGALGALGYGLALGAVTVAALLDGVTSYRLLLALLGVAVAALGFGIVWAMRAFARETTLRTWIVDE